MDQEEPPQSNWATLKVLREDRWYRVYQTEDGIPVTVSKFITDKIPLTEASLRDEWSSWAPSERVLFAQAFAQKSSFAAEDLPILDFLIAANDPAYIQVVIAPALPRYSDRDSAVALLLARLESDREPQTNAITALLKIAATDSPRRSEIVEALKRVHGRLAGLLDAVTANLDDRSKTDLRHTLDFITCSAAVAHLENSSAYLDQIRPFTGHPNRAIAAAAASHLARAQHRTQKPSKTDSNKRE